MRDDDRRAARHQRLERVLDEQFGARVEAAGRLVEHEHRRVDQCRPSQRHELALPRRQSRAALAHLGVEPVGELLEPFGAPIASNAVAQVVVGRVGPCDADVVGDRAAEQESLLWHDDHPVPQRGERGVAEVDATERDDPSVGS